MNRQLLPASRISLRVPRVPVWATSRGAVDSDVEAAFMAGSALKAATASVKLMRRTEDESALRDVWVLRWPGDEPGPVADLLGISWSDAFAKCIEDLTGDQSVIRS